MKQVGKFNSWISLRVFLLFTPYSRLELSSIQSLAFKASINFTRHEEKIDWLKPSWIYLRSIPYSILQLLSIQFLALLVSFSAIKHGEKTDWLIPQPLLDVICFILFSLLQVPSANTHSSFGYFPLG